MNLLDYLNAFVVYDLFKIPRNRLTEKAFVVI